LTFCLFCLERSTLLASSTYWQRRYFVIYQAYRFSSFLASKYVQYFHFFNSKTFQVCHQAFHFTFVELIYQRCFEKKILIHHINPLASHHILKGEGILKQLLCQPWTTFLY